MSSSNRCGVGSGAWEDMQKAVLATRLFWATQSLVLTARRWAVPGRCRLRVRVRGREHLFKKIYVKMVLSGPSNRINTPLLKSYYLAHALGAISLILWTWKLFPVDLNMGHWTDLFYQIKRTIMRLRSTSILLYLLNSSLCQTSATSLRLRK